MKKVPKKRILLPINAFLIKKNSQDAPWAEHYFLDEESAKNYFEATCIMEGSNLNWDDYELIKVEITKFK